MGRLWPSFHVLIYLPWLNCTDFDFNCVPSALRIVRLLLQYSNQLDLNAGDANKNTALHMACEDGNLEIGRLLLEAGADRDALNKWEKTPDQMADPQVAKAVQGLMVAP